MALRLSFFGYISAMNKKNKTIRSLIAVIISISGIAWAEQALPVTSTEDVSNKIAPTTLAENDYFGSSVSVSSKYIAIGATGDDGYKGKVYLYDVKTRNLMHTLITDDVATGDRLGFSLAIDNDNVIVGVHLDSNENGDYAGALYIFSAITGDQTTKIIPDDGAAIEQFGGNAKISDRYLAVNSALGHDSGVTIGSVYVFDLDTNNLVHKLTPGGGAHTDYFGSSIDIHGDYLVAGAPHDSENGPKIGSAYIYDLTTGLLVRKLTAEDGSTNDTFGSSVAINSTHVVVGASHSQEGVAGEAYVFDLSTGDELHKLVPNTRTTDDLFGVSAAITGNWAIIGSENSVIESYKCGAVYIFDIPSGKLVYRLAPEDRAEGARFGHDVSVMSGNIAVAALGDNDNRGAVYLYSFNDLFQKIVPSDLSVTHNVVSPTNSEAVISFTTCEGFNYSLEAGTDLIGWTEIESFVGIDELHQFTHTGLHNVPKMFYRVKIAITP